MTPFRIRPDDSVVLVVDIQDKLLAKVVRAEPLVQTVGFLLDVAAVLGLPVRATEQYPTGLGPTTDAIRRRLTSPVPPKTAFSCGGADGVLPDLTTLNRRTVVVVGIEAHVCVAQTALDLLAAGFQVVVPVDAVSSRHRIDRDTAVRRLELAGAVPTTAEAVAFEWVGDARHPKFKEVSRLVTARQRTD